MQEHALEPWMLQADGRDDNRPFLTIDFCTWPTDQPITPLPPVPLIGLGPATHPQAARADILMEDPITLPSLAASISKAPRACAVLAQLLRSLEGLPADRALPLESLAFAALQGGTEHSTWLAQNLSGPPQPPGTLHMQRDGNVLHLLLDRPAARNAIDRPMRDALFDAFSLAALDGTITKVRLRATSRAFSMGADLAEFGTTRDPVAAHAIRARTLPAHAMARRPEIYDIHIQGACVGAGLEMAAFARHVTASPNAWFQLPETAMGILPGFGGCVSIPARTGRQRAAALMLSGKRINAQTALAWGLIDAIMDEPPANERGPHKPS
jgi:enoyl-CoA hydratase/carnithine racemase